MPNVPLDNIAFLDVVSVNQPGQFLKGIITLTCDGKQYEATCSFPLEPSLKEGDKLRIMHRGPTVLVRRIINGKLDRVKFNLVFW
jgi:hypothetical protein